MMSDNEDYIDLYLKSLADCFTAEELVELLNLDVWQVIEMYREEILESKTIKEALKGYR